MRQQVALFASSTGANVTAWELSTGSQLCAYKGNASPRNGLCVIGGQYLAASQLSKGPIHFWSWHKESALQRSFAGGQVTCLAASPCGSYLAGGCATGAVWVWDLASGRLLSTWLPHLKAVTAAAWSDGGSFLVTGSEDTQVHVVMTAELLGGGASAAGPGAAGFGGLGAAEGPQPLHTWSGHTLAVTGVAVGSGECNAVVATCSLDRTAKLWSLAQGCLLRSVTLGSTAECLALSPGEQRMYVGCGNGDVAEVPLVGDADSAADLAALAGPGSSAASAAAAAAVDGGVGYRLLKGHRDAVTCIALTGDGSHVVAGCRDGAARLFEAASRQVVRVLDSPAKGPITGVVVVDRHPGMGGASGGAAAPPPSRALPLAQLCKYEGMTGNLQPWEAGPVLLSGGGDGLNGAAGASPGLPPAAAALDGPSLRFVGGVGGDAFGEGAAAAGARGGEVAQQLREDNARLQQQLRQALEAAQQWAGLHGQLYDTALNVLEQGVVGPGGGAK